MQIRLAEILREIARGGLAGAFAGLIVGGLGGRLVMMIAARLNPEATGLFTENGERIGAFTVNGTLALLVFGGLFGGIAAGMVWVVVSPWLPASGWRRMGAAGALAVALGGMLLARSDSRDFVILRNDAAIVVLLLALVAAIGVALAWLDGALERRLPRPEEHPTRYLALYGVVAMIGLLFMPVVLGFYLSRETCACGNPPVLVGWGLIVVGVVTAASWAFRIASTTPGRRQAFVATGRLSTLAAALLGLAYLLPELAGILEAA